MSEHLGYRSDIDGLRAVAVLLVTVFHFDLLEMGKAGFMGVDVFFVISGFLITSIIVKQIESGSFAYSDFLYRRLRRLFPALIATNSLYLAAGYFLLLPSLYSELATETIASQAYVSNVYFWQTVNYFGLHAQNAPLLHTWSLGIEEQFYIGYPLALLILFSLGRVWVSVGLATMLAVSLALAAIFTPIKPEASFYLLPTRAWELLLGGFIAWGSVSLREFPISATLANLCGVALIIAGVVLYQPDVGFPAWFALYPALGSALLLVSDHPKAPVSQFLRQPMLVYIGQISYPVYLVHWPLMIMVKDWFADYTMVIRGLTFCASFVLGGIIYHIIEEPVRTGRILSRKKQFVGAVVGLLGATFGWSAFVLNTDGASFRFSDEAVEVLEYSGDTAKAFHHCEQIAVDGTTCYLGMIDVAPSLLIVGDSHANAMAQALDIALEKLNVSAVFSFASGCMPVTNMGDSKCTKHIDASLRVLDDYPTIDMAFLISIWRQPLGSGSLHEGNWVSGNELEDAFQQELVNTIAYLDEKGVRPLILEPLFASPNNVPEALAKNIIFGKNLMIDVSVDDHYQQFGRLSYALTRAEQAGAGRVSILKYMCSEEVCSGTRGGKPIFTDNNHLAAWTASWVADLLYRELAPYVDGEAGEYRDYQEE